MLRAKSVLTNSEKKKKAGHEALLETVSDKYTGLIALQIGAASAPPLTLPSVQRLGSLFAYGADNINKFWQSHLKILAWPRLESKCRLS